MNYFLLLFGLFVYTTANAQLTITINTNKPVQTIRNFGTSGCWFTEEIGAKWPDAQKKRIAELLFSRGTDQNGNPLGIGLSAFRYNIGAGTTEQGDSSGIQLPAHRVECFLNPDGSYNWNKQKGYTWMLQQAKNYGVQDLIAFVNSPPVQFTKTGYGFKLTKDSAANLKEDKYQAYADFLATVLKHFDREKLHFNYISPVNEPQWDWSGVPGQAKQEGSPFTNREIYKVTTLLNSSLDKEKLSTRILMPEAAMLDHLFTYSPKSTGRQIDQFWNPKSELYVGKLSHATNFVEGHGYFTDNGSQLVTTRQKLRDTLKKYSGLEYWQSEYSMLGNGYRDGKTARLEPVDYALFLAKVIHQDLVSGNASAWHYWNAYEPGSAESPRYYLIALKAGRGSDKDSLYSVTKNLWALGHYSLFIRPGMKRLECSRNDDSKDTLVAKETMVSAFADESNKKLVSNLINYTSEAKEVTLKIEGFNGGSVSAYRTSASEDLKKITVSRKPADGRMVVILPPRSITSFVITRK